MVYSISDFTWPPPINPPNQNIIHPPMGGGVSTDVKSSNRIDILGHGLFNF